MVNAQILDIAEVIEQSGLSASALRYYEEKGLIESVARKGLRRQFNASVLQRLALISLGRSADFSLDEIATMFTSPGPNIDKQKLLDKAEQLDKKINQLSAMREGLRHAADCPAPSHLECPKFLRLLRIANKRKQKSAK